MLIGPLQAEFGWSTSTISAAIGLTMALYGLTAPFAAALTERFGIRRIVVCALLGVAVGSGLTVFMTSPWQLALCWGLLVGLGTGSMAMSLVATVTGRWFVARRGLVSGVLAAGGAAGQLVFLPVVAQVSAAYGWRPAALGTTAGHPAGGPMAARPLAAGFAICGATTDGLVQPHVIPAAHDHGMPVTTAAALPALVGLFDIAGTIASGWLTDPVDPRLLLAHYSLRGLSLVLLPPLFGADLQASMIVFIVFYGLDWVATVPPTLALCRQHVGARAAVRPRPRRRRGRRHPRLTPARPTPGRAEGSPGNGAVVGEAGAGGAAVGEGGQPDRGAGALGRDEGVAEAVLEEVARR